MLEIETTRKKWPVTGELSADSRDWNSESDDQAYARAKLPRCWLPKRTDSEDFPEQRH